MVLDLLPVKNDQNFIFDNRGFFEIFRNLVVTYKNWVQNTQNKEMKPRSSLEKKYLSETRSGNVLDGA